jgi:hypothetical protein
MTAEPTTMQAPPFMDAFDWRKLPPAERDRCEMMSTDKRWADRKFFLKNLDEQRNDMQELRNVLEMMPWQHKTDVLLLTMEEQQAVKALILSLSGRERLKIPKNPLAPRPETDEEAAARKKKKPIESAKVEPTERIRKLPSGLPQYESIDQPTAPPPTPMKPAPAAPGELPPGHVLQGPFSYPSFWPERAKPQVHIQNIKGGIRLFTFTVNDVGEVYLLGAYEALSHEFPYNRMPARPHAAPAPAPR